MKEWYLGGEGSQPASRGLAGGVGGLRHLVARGQVGSRVGGVPLLAGERRHRHILARQDAGPDLGVRLYQLHQANPTSSVRKKGNSPLEMGVREQAGLVRSQAGVACCAISVGTAQLGLGLWW